MSGSILGKVFTISTWGESHGEAIGVVIDGCPSGIHIGASDIQKDLNLRRPGANKFNTNREEDDTVHILSGIFNGITTGAPISLLVYNKDQQSKDYSNIQTVYRPGHADYTFEKKYGFRDYRGGGRSSGRETLSRVAAGAIAKKILEELNIRILTYTHSIGNVTINNFDESYIKGNSLFMPDREAYKKAESLIGQCINEKDSLGGIIECRILGLPYGIGEPTFDKLDASMAKAMFSIGAVKGFEIGLGFEASKIRGSENNDQFNEKKRSLTNNSGGVLGGISNGDIFIFKTAFKPTPSIGISQKAINSDGNVVDLEIKGRHDPVIVPRAVIVVEAMAAITVVDLLFQNMFSKIENLKNLYIKS